MALYPSYRTHHFIKSLFAISLSPDFSKSSCNHRKKISGTTMTNFSAQLILFVASIQSVCLGFDLKPFSVQITGASRGTVVRSAREDINAKVDNIIVSGAGDPFHLVDLDMEHAKDCAEHFGKCSVKELKQIKNDLHQHRIQTLVFGDAAPEDAFQNRLIEEEISLQLNLLEEQMPPSTLFPDADPMAELPHKNEGVEVAKKVKREEQSFILEEMAEEGIMDSLAICGLIALVMLAPQFL